MNATANITIASIHVAKTMRLTQEESGQDVAATARTQQSATGLEIQFRQTPTVPRRQICLRCFIRQARLCGRKRGTTR